MLRLLLFGSRDHIDRNYTTVNSNYIGCDTVIIKEGLKSILRIGSAHINALATRFKIAQILHICYFSENELQLIFTYNYSEPKLCKISECS